MYWLVEEAEVQGVVELLDKAEEHCIFEMAAETVRKTVVEHRNSCFSRPLRWRRRTCSCAPLHLCPLMSVRVEVVGAEVASIDSEYICLIPGLER